MYDSHITGTISYSRESGRMTICSICQFFSRGFRVHALAQEGKYLKAWTVSCIRCKNCDELKVLCEYIYQTHWHYICKDKQWSQEDRKQDWFRTTLNTAALNIHVVTTSDCINRKHTQASPTYSLPRLLLSVPVILSIQSVKLKKTRSLKHKHLCGTKCYFPA